MLLNLLATACLSVLLRESWPRSQSCFLSILVHFLYSVSRIPCFSHFIPGLLTFLINLLLVSSDLRLECFSLHAFCDLMLSQGLQHHMMTTFKEHRHFQENPGPYFTRHSTNILILLDISYNIA